MPLCAASLVCAVVWVVYGAAMRDAAVFFSNLPGVLCGIVQLALLALFGKGEEGPGKEGAMARKGNGGDGGYHGEDPDEEGLLPIREGEAPQSGGGEG